MKPKEKPRMDNPETLTTRMDNPETLATRMDNPETLATKNEQSRDIGNIGHKTQNKWRKQKQIWQHSKLNRWAIQTPLKAEGAIQTPLKAEGAIQIPLKAEGGVKRRV